MSLKLLIDNLNSFYFSNDFSEPEDSPNVSSPRYASSSTLPQQSSGADVSLFFFLLQKLVKNGKFCIGKCNYVFNTTKLYYKIVVFVFRKVELYPRIRYISKLLLLRITCNCLLNVNSVLKEIKHDNGNYTYS